MKKTILASLASILVVTSMTQIAAASERTARHHQTAQVRNANASMMPAAASGGYTRDDLAHLQNGAESAPAGR
jgi:hypothetical protein